MPEERVFSEQEVGQIIRRAVQLTEEGAAPSYKAGVTKHELEKIAQEVGVSPEALQRAILEAGEHKGKRGLFHLTEEFERVVEGELDPSQFDLITEDVKTFANAGQPAVAQVGRKMTMSAWTGVGQAKIDVTSRNGRTRLKVKSNALLQMIMTLHPGLMATLITVGSLSERGMGWLAAWLGFAIMTVAVFLFTVLTKKGHQKAEALADDLRNRIAETLTHQQGDSPAAVEKVAEDAEPLRQRLGRELQ